MAYSFALGAFSFNIATAGNPIDMDFDLVVSDSDGDTTTGTLAMATILDNGSDIEGVGTADETLIGGSTDDTLTGNSGADNLTGGTGVVTFVYAAGDGGASVALAHVISDFENGTEVIDLTGGLAFGDLPIDQSSNVVGDGINDTVISVTAGGEILTVLDGITTMIDVNDFVQPSLRTGHIRFGGGCR